MAPIQWEIFTYAVWINTRLLHCCSTNPSNGHNNLESSLILFSKIYSQYHTTSLKAKFHTCFCGYNSHWPLWALVLLRGNKILFLCIKCPNREPTLKEGGEGGGGQVDMVSGCLLGLVVVVPRFWQWEWPTEHAEIHGEIQLKPPRSLDICSFSILLCQDWQHNQALVFQANQWK